MDQSVPIRMKILMVEDDAAVARALIRSLKLAGHEVSWCDGFVNGLDAIRTAPFTFDAVLLDRNVGPHIGWDLMKDVPTGVRMVLMSGDPPKGSPPHWLKGTPTSILLAMLEGRDAAVL